MIDFQAPIIVAQVGVFMDGGTAVVNCRSDKNQTTEILFMQYISWVVYDFEKYLPGRIYVDGVLIDQRSQLEADIIAALTKEYALESISPEEKALLLDKIRYVQSDAYLTDPRKVTMKPRKYFQKHPETKTDTGPDENL